MAATIKSLASILEGFGAPEASAQRQTAAPEPEALAATESTPGGEAETASDGDLPAAGDQPVTAEASLAVEAPASGPVELPPARRSHSGLKLLVDPERLTDFNDAPVVVAHTRNKGTVRNLTAVYYDTPGRALFRAGFTLNVRRSGQRYVQAVKMEAKRGADPLWRGEWETPVSSMAPDLGSVMPLVPPHVRTELSGRRCRRCSRPASAGIRAPLPCRPAEWKWPSTTAGWKPADGRRQ